MRIVIVLDELVDCNGDEAHCSDGSDTNDSANAKKFAFHCLSLDAMKRLVKCLCQVGPRQRTPI